MRNNNWFLSRIGALLLGALCPLFFAGLAQAQTPPPTVSFYYLAPTTILQGDTAVLVITISDPSGQGFTGGQTTAPFTYAAGVTNRGTGNLAPYSVCGGTLTASAGAGDMQVTGVDIGPGVYTCYIYLEVTTAAPGTYTTDYPSGVLFTASTGSNATAALATLTSVPPVIVSSTADSGGGSLRAAITLANGGGTCPAAPAFIQFAIPGTGPHTIQPITQLPAITCANVTIDGYTQPGAAANTDNAGGNNAVIKIALNGSSCLSGCDGLQIQAGSVTVKGLAIHSFAGSGILTNFGANLFGNYIGTDPGGMNALGNTVAGVQNTDQYLALGSSLPGDRNLVSANGVGVWLTGSATADIINNQIGGKRDGSVGNGNAGQGVYFSGVTNATSNINGNFVRYNGAAGIVMDAATTGEVTLSGNASYANGGIGIDFGNDGPTPNDEAAPPYDTDGVQNYPVITSVTHVGSDTVVSGYLKSVAGAPASIELYHNNVLTAQTEGEDLIDAFSTSLDPTGYVAFSRTITGFLADNVSAATTVDTCSEGCMRSSEYSPSVAVAVSQATLTLLTPLGTSFGDATVNTSSRPLQVTLVNNGVVPVNISSVFVTPVGFSLGINTCPASLVPATYCTVEVIFTPTAITPYTGTFAVLSDAAGTLPVTFTGAGVAVPAPALQVAAALDFGSVIVGELATKSLVLTNDGTAPLTIASTSVSSNDFSVSGSCGSIAAKASCTLTMGFKPGATGVRNDSLVIVSNDPQGPRKVVLTGTGQPQPKPVLALSATSVAFGNTLLGAGNATQNVSLSNVGGSVMQIRLIVASAPFAIETDCGPTLAVGASCIASVKFLATIPGAIFGQMIIDTNAVGGIGAVALSGIGCRANDIRHARLGGASCGP